VQILFWAPRYGACLRLPAGMDSQTFQKAFPFIAGAQPYRQQQAQRGIPAQPHALRQQTGLPSDLYDLICFSREERQLVEEALHQLGIEVVDTASSKVRVRFNGDLAVLRDIVGVKIVDPARGPVLSTPAGAAPIKAAAYTSDSLLSALDILETSLDGAGQVIAVADTGLDTGVNDGRLHADFRGRVIFLRSWPVNPSWEGYLRRPGAFDDAADRNSGHGTHVAGLALGSGTASRLNLRGIAPAAQLVFQAIEQYVEVKPERQAQVRSGYYLAGRPLNLRELFQESYDQGARILVNAWGDPAQGQYTNDSYEVDLFLSEHPDAVILFAAGNDGFDRNGDRVGDPQTIYAPATAKNCIAVGATEGPRPNCGLPATWGTMDSQRQRFLNPLDRTQEISGNPERMALFSACGPTRDQRIKPDVCAPGTKLAAPRSSLLSLTRKGWGLANPLPYYMYNVGTSMSVGVAGGFMAILRQAWQQHNGGSAPSGAALKALALLGAQPIRQRAGSPAQPESPEEARSFCGFGRLSLAGALPSDQTVLFDPILGLTTGEAREYRLQITQPGPFKAVLAWYDAPGEVLVNDLNLNLIDPTGERVWGNHPTGSPGQTDRVNSVEVIHVPSLQPGDYILHLSAANVMTGEQNCALAARLSPGSQISLPDADFAAVTFVAAVPDTRDPALL
jgi:subtilisin family serine protease